MKKFVVIALLLSGCAVGPNYHAPKNDVSGEWSSRKESCPIMLEEAPLTAWWQVFDDPLLTKYIEKAAENNYDLRTAEANVLQARALRQVSASSFYPQVGADFNATRLHFSKNGLIFGSQPAAAAGAAGAPSAPGSQSLFSALFDATWELDIFGKTRRSVEAADASVGSAIEQRNDVLITVLAEIARTYIEVRANQKIAQLVEENIALLEQQQEIIAKQFETGYVGLINVETIEATLSTERSLLPDLKAKVYRGIYTLSVLTGEVPEALVDELIVPQRMPAAPIKVSVGIRSELLRRRPDIRKAERQLAAATANIGVAVASFFPSFLLYGLGGLQSVKINKLFEGSSNFWVFGGNADIPIFQGGKLVGNYRANKAAASAAACTYRQTVLTALEETESALVAYAEEVATSNQLRSAVMSDEVLVKLSSERNAKGLVSMPNYIDAERQLNAARQSLVQSEMTALIDLIALYKALGGGWENQDEKKIENCSALTDAS